MKRKTEKKLQMFKKHWALFMEDMTAPITLLVFFGVPLAIFKGYPDKGSWVYKGCQWSPRSPTSWTSHVHQRPRMSVNITDHATYLFRQILNSSAKSTSGGNWIVAISRTCLTKDNSDCRHTLHTKSQEQIQFCLQCKVTLKITFTSCLYLVAYSALDDK